jgi:uncharacterized protein YjbJ (UPF0337 family)
MWALDKLRHKAEQFAGALKEKTGVALRDQRTADRGWDRKNAGKAKAAGDTVRGKARKARRRLSH